VFQFLENFQSKKAIPSGIAFLLLMGKGATITVIELRNKEKMALY
jgi:hypothetical protein